ncbi:enkurin [Xenentodon cancila]
MSETFYPQERVYNLIPKEESEVKKPPRYISKFRPTVVLENKLAKDSMRMMGPAKVAVPSPEKYLKKHSKESKLPETSKCSKDASNACTCTSRKPPVPTRTDHPKMGVQTKRDFVKTAAVVQMKPKPMYVDTSKGHKQLLENSGLFPKYITKKDYGQVPAYLQQRCEAERWAQEEYNRLVKEQREQDAMQQLSDEERQGVLEGLKKRWDTLNHEYQSLSFTISTLSKKAYKQQLEEAMKQLENDIDLFQRHKTIYIPKN